MQRTYIVYILANRPHGTIYTGVTNNLVRRVHQHRGGSANSFTTRHKCHSLVWYEQHTDINETTSREKRIKRWYRKWNNALIEKTNPQWSDLYASLM